MKKFLLGLLLLVPSVLFATDPYYNYQQYRIIPDTTNISNDMLFRGDFKLTNDTTNVNLLNCNYPLVMYATGTVKCNRVESDTIIYGSTETIFSDPVTFVSSVTFNDNLHIAGYSIFDSSVTISSDTIINGNLIVNDYSTFNSSVTISSNTIINGNSTVIGYSNFNSSVTISTDTVMNGNLSNRQFTRVSGYANARVNNYPSSVYTKITYNAEDYDSLNEFNISTSSFTAVYTGFYIIDATADVTQTVADRPYGLAIFKNGVNTKFRWIHSATTNEMNVANSAMLLLNAGDIIDFRFYNGDGVGTTDIEGGSLQTWFTIHRIMGNQ